jgi:hypothetical protein
MLRFINGALHNGPLLVHLVDPAIQYCLRVETLPVAGAHRCGHENLVLVPCIRLHDDARVIASDDVVVVNTILEADSYCSFQLVTVAGTVHSHRCRDSLACACQIEVVEQVEDDGQQTEVVALVEVEAAEFWEVVEYRSLVVLALARSRARPGPSPSRLHC